MTTRPSTGFHPSQILRLLAPGPLALGLGAYVDPTAWRVMRASRHAIDPRAHDDGEAGRTER